MILASNHEPFQTGFSNGDCSGVTDVPVAKGGEGRGFGPHDLLEAALATCMAMTARKYAQEGGLPLTSVQCEVRIDRSSPDRVKLTYDLRIDGNMTSTQERALREAVARCPVARTLTGPIALEPTN